jgi:hypothetical protein
MIPFSVLKALLAVTCLGVTDDQGLFVPRLPDGEGPTDAAERIRRAARLFAQLWRETGTLEGSLIAWRAGAIRARRVVRASGEEEDDLFRFQAYLHEPYRAERIQRRLRLHLLVPFREEARELMCSVTGVALGLEARWPVDSLETEPAGAGVRLAAGPGEPVRATMPGRVHWAATDGSRGLCVEVDHGCDLRTSVCGLAEASVPVGARVETGQPLGTAGPGRPWFGLRIGTVSRDPRVLHPGDEPP